VLASSLQLQLSITTTSTNAKFENKKHIRYLGRMRSLFHNFVIDDLFIMKREESKLYYVYYNYNVILFKIFMQSEQASEF
jgi:hypothetical protein